MIKTFTSWTCGLFIALFTFMFGRESEILRLLYILIFMMVIDIIVGAINASNHREFKLRVIRIGIFKKVSTLFIVSIAYQIDKIDFLQGSVFLEKVVILSFITYEIISVLNNIEIQGVKIPVIIKNTVAKMLEVFKK